MVVRKVSDPASPRRAFDGAIIAAVYRWEFLRRNPEYRRDVQLWIEHDAEALGLEDPHSETVTNTLDGDFVRTSVNPLEGCRVEKDGVILPPFDSRVSERYAAVCEKWGLVLLFHPATAFSEQAMSLFPIFKDTPGRQIVVKDEHEWRKRVRRLPDLSKGRTVGTPKDLLEELNREDHERVQRGEPPAGPSMSPRDLRRYLRKVPVDRGPFQLRTKRTHLKTLELYLRVFDLREDGKKSFGAIAAVCRISGAREASRAYQVARKLVGLPRITEVVLPAAIDDDKAREVLESHLRSCEACLRLNRPCPALEKLIEMVLGRDKWLREGLPGDIEATDRKRARGGHVAPKQDHDPDAEV